MSPKIKRLALNCLRAVGAFALARALSRKGLRILCYHGIALEDEHVFYGKLFMHSATFRQRMHLLRDQGYNVLGLDAALAALRANALPPDTVVITIDDGWVGTGKKALPTLKELGWPATLYVASRDVEQELPVFDVLIRYLLWLARGKELDLSALDSRISGKADLSDRHAADRALEQILSLYTNECSAAERLAVAERLASLLGIDLERIRRDRLIHLMTLSELQQAAHDGFDIQLHTHTHRLPQTDRTSVEDEINANRAVLSRVSSSPLEHLCYPSGEYHPRQFQWLRALGVKSATTCKPGFSYPATEVFELGRMLDGEEITQIEFEAELSGVLECMRRLRRRLAGGRAAQSET